LLYKFKYLSKAKLGYQGMDACCCNLHILKTMVVFILIKVYNKDKSII